jgi:hypothetical protein
MTVLLWGRVDALLLAGDAKEATVTERHDSLV